MTIVLRPGTPADATVCGTICYEAFKAVCTAHNFPPDFPSPEVASGLLSMLLAHPRFYSVVAEAEGRIVGSNFLDERSCIVGLGPITVDPTVQNRGVGARLMQDAIAARCGARRRPMWPSATASAIRSMVSTAESN
jgi:predicted N-acetyltransferase YhbS